MGMSIQDKRKRDAENRTQIMTIAHELLEKRRMSQEHYNELASECQRDVESAGKMLNQHLERNGKDKTYADDRNNDDDDPDTELFTDADRAVIERYKASQQDGGTRRRDGEMGRGGNRGQDQS